MVNGLKKYFPMIRSREEVLEEIHSKPELLSLLLNQEVKIFEELDREIERQQLIEESDE